MTLSDNTEMPVDKPKRRTVIGHPVPAEPSPVPRASVEFREAAEVEAETPITVGAQPARRKMDPELQTMAKIDALLCDLGDEGVFRVLTWLTNKYAQTDKVMSRYVEMDRAGISGQALLAYQDQVAAMKGG